MTPFMNRFVQAKQAVDAVRPLMELLYPSADPKADAATTTEQSTLASATSVALPLPTALP